MMTNDHSGTQIDEIAADIYRISTPASDVPGGFSFNQYLIRDHEPLLFHTGLRRHFSYVREAVARILPPESLTHIAFSHYEADECGSLNDWLKTAPRSTPVCSRVAKMVSVDDVALRPAHALGDGETLALGSHAVVWIDAPHLPHAWECGFLFERTTRTLLCGDLFTQGGERNPPLTEGDILGPSEEFRKAMDYFSHAKNTRELLQRLAKTEPRTLACMHGSAWQGDGSQLLLQLASELER